MEQKEINKYSNYAEKILNYLKTSNFSKEDIYLIKKIDEFINFLKDKNNLWKFKENNNKSKIINNINNYKNTNYDLIVEIFINFKLYENWKKIDISIIPKIERYLKERQNAIDLTRIKNEELESEIKSSELPLFKKYWLKTQMWNLDISLFNKNKLNIKELQNFLILKMWMFSLGELLKTDKIWKYWKRTNVLLYNYLRHKWVLKEWKIFKQKNISNKILELIKNDIKNAKKWETREVNNIEIPSNNIEKDNNLPNLWDILTYQKEESNILKPKEKINDSYENLLNEIIDDEKYKKINKESLKNSLLNLSKTKLSNLVQELKEINKENIERNKIFKPKSDIIEIDRYFLNKDYSFFVPIIKEILNWYEQKGNFWPIETSEIIEILLKINFVIS